MKLRIGYDALRHPDDRFTPVAAWHIAYLKSSEEGRKMPAKSKAQQMAAGAALAAKRGEKEPSELDGASRSMYDSMSEEELEEMSSSKRRGKPQHDEQS